MRRQSAPDCKFSDLDLNATRRWYIVGLAVAIADADTICAGMWFGRNGFGGGAVSSFGGSVIGVDLTGSLTDCESAAAVDVAAGVVVAVDDMKVAVTFSVSDVLTSWTLWTFLRRTDDVVSLVSVPFVETVPYFADVNETFEDFLSGSSSSSSSKIIWRFFFRPRFDFRAEDTPVVNVASSFDKDVTSDDEAWDFFVSFAGLFVLSDVTLDFRPLDWKQNNYFYLRLTSFFLHLHVPLQFKLIDNGFFWYGNCILIIVISSWFPLDILSLVPTREPNLGFNDISLISPPLRSFLSDVQLEAESRTSSLHSSWASVKRRSSFILQSHLVLLTVLIWRGNFRPSFLLILASCFSVTFSDLVPENDAVVMADVGVDGWSSRSPKRSGIVATKSFKKSKRFSEPTQSLLKKV